MHSRRGINAAILGLFLGVFSTAARAIDVWTAKSGFWSDPTVWVSSNGVAINRLPNANDDVLIRLAHVVTVNITSATAHHIDVGYPSGGFGVGSLFFSTSTNSTLTMTATLWVNPGGTLALGTAANPVAPAVKASLILAQPDLVDEHGLYLYDLSVFSAHGASKVPVALGPGSIPSGAVSFSAANAQVSGWRVGDVITLGHRDDQATYDNETEERTITALTPSGGNTVVQWSGGLSYDHVGAAGVRVANLTRNVVVRSSGTDLGTDTSFFKFNGAGSPSMSLSLAEFSYLGVGWDYARMGVSIADGTVISSCTFHHNGSGLAGGSSVRVSNSIFYANAWAGAYYSFFWADDWNSNDFLYNDFIANATPIGQDEDVVDFRFIGNHVYSNEGMGISMNGDGIIVARNRIYNNGHGPQSDCGIESKSSGILISSNTVSYNADIGVCLDGDGVSVGNRISGNGYIGYSAGDRSIAVSNEIFQNGDAGITVGGRALIVKNNVYLNGSEGVWSNGGSTYTLVETSLGYDAAGTNLPNAGFELWMYQNSDHNQPRLYGCRVNPVGGIRYDASESGVLAYNLNYATGTFNAMGTVWMEPGDALTIDHAQPSWRSTATTPVLIRGTDHTASVRATSDANTVSQLISIRFDGAAWRVEGSASGLMYGPFTGNLVNQSVAGQFNLDFTPDPFTTAREDDQIVFALIAASKDAGVQKKLLYSDNGWGNGGGALVLPQGSSFTLRGIPGTAALVDLAAGASYPYFLESAGAVTIENAGVRRSSGDGLHVMGTASVAITSTTFDSIGEPSGAYITAENLASSAVFRNLSFDPGSPDPNAPLSVRVTGTDTALNWVMEGFSGARSGDASDFDPNQRIYWAGSSPVGTPGNFSATVFSDGLSLSWTAPSRPPVFYRSGYRLYASTVSAAGPFGLVASPAASSTTYVHLGLLPETSYYYRLEAVDLVGTLSSVAASTSAITGDFSQPELTASVGARAVGVAWSQAATLTFNKGMNTGSVSGAVSLSRLKDNLGNLLTPPAAMGVSVTPDFSGSVFTVTPSSALAGNSVYELSVSTGARDLLNQPISSSATLRFVTLMDRSVRNVVTEGTLGAAVDVPAGALAADGYVTAGPGPSMTVDATRKLIANTGDALRSPVGAAEDLEMLDAAGAPQTFSSPVTVTLPFLDADKDGVVDGPSPVRVKTLSIYWLDEAKSVWHRLPSSRVDAAAGTVSAETSHFTTFAAIGQADTDLSGAHAFPNPFVGGAGASAVTFTGLGQISTVRLYTTSGRLVREINAAPGAGVVDWDLKNDDGELVASGLYLYRITSGGSTATGKLGVVR